MTTRILKEIQASEKIVDVLLTLERVFEHSPIAIPQLATHRNKTGITTPTMKALPKILETCQGNGATDLATIVSAAMDHIAKLSDERKTKKGPPTLADYENSYQLQDNGCWQWISSKSRVTHVGKSMSPRKAIWLVTRGAVRPDEILMDGCGNKQCVNPNHAKIVLRKAPLQKPRAVPEEPKACKMTVFAMSTRWR